MNTPTKDQLDLAGQVVDLVTRAWSLRARVADVRGLRVGWVVSPLAYEALITTEGDVIGNGPPAVQLVEVDGQARALFLEYEMRPDSNMDAWGLVLALSPGES